MKSFGGKLDHLVLGVSDLEQGMDMIERQTRVRPMFGGRHTGRGTHNALLSLGDHRYLEVIAPDPKQAGTPIAMFPTLAALTESKIVSWAIAVADIDATSKSASSAGHEIFGPLDGSRTRSDRKLLTWRTLVVAANPPLELIPFFIEWGEGTPHPSQDSPSGCMLTSLRLEHTDPERIGLMLATFGVAVNVVRGERPKLCALLQSPTGEVEIS